MRSSSKANSMREKSKGYADYSTDEPCALGEEQARCRGQDGGQVLGEGHAACGPPVQVSRRRVQWSQTRSEEQFPEAMDGRRLGLRRQTQTVTLPSSSRAAETHTLREETNQPGQAQSQNAVEQTTGRRGQEEQAIARSSVAETKTEINEPKVILNVRLAHKWLPLALLTFGERRST